ncbi:MAG: ABC transporter ATP-binding protein [Hyphomonas sp.]|uniref:ABC transporter ATP-binding protein n=1 Tax=Hyphomonas sp. TaxID=87 RepID=UPI0017AE1FF8|nr:ABC transporter ATP-binding protein [Hyphomonas sp.]MBU3921415.1 ABC transporter ATP-binding protein [Alphaproteobacteria bacterium]MBA3067401.1 ABC transporter ATP-binding protein [Hyphomonas sp.]MBU4061047.1 ABC transporter ATP-binding protein [Alphaproteobacteria bacterium]MBU4165903.1 ABC transporter ATP-binding protein [Alphaproteobacteria bacterium]MBU4568053.1 ABC transporter ATP-binding protein [Alphaproteobacteria bacterium]
MSEKIIEVHGLGFAWKQGLQVLDIPEFSVDAGERVFLRGPSGSGKSTLLGLIAGVLAPQTGTIRVLGEDMARLSAARRDRLRADHVGVIFQMFNLVPYLSVTGNVLLPLRFSSARRKAAGSDADGEARRLLARLGLEDEQLLKRRVSDLSVGQQQRVAAARALIGAPKLIIADEPTSALDADARDRFIALLSEEVTRSGASLLFVSHDRSLAPLFTRAVDLAAINRVGVSA